MQPDYKCAAVEERRNGSCRISFLPFPAGEEGGQRGERPHWLSPGINIAEVSGAANDAHPETLQVSFISRCERAPPPFILPFHVKFAIQLLMRHVVKSHSASQVARGLSVSMFVMHWRNTQKPFNRGSECLNTALWLHAANEQQWPFQERKLYYRQTHTHTFACFCSIHKKEEAWKYLHLMALPAAVRALL